MRLYIDKQNIESFVQGSSSNPEQFEACNMMLKKHFDVRLNFTLEEFSQSELCMNWSNTLLDGRGNNVIHFCSDSNPIFPARPINPDTFDNAFTIDDSFAVYLIDDPAVTNIAQKGNYLVAGPGQEVNTLTLLMIGDEDNKYIQSIPLRTKFITGNWDGLDNSVLPCSDVIISDSYILSNSILLYNNLILLLSKLTERLNHSTVNVVIFCLKETKDSYQNLVMPNWSSIRGLIKRELSYNGITATVSFVAPQNEAEFGEHDRTAFTNYLLYIPGATLNFYNSQGILTTRGRHFHVQSTAHSDYYQEAVDYVADMQKIINDISNGAKQGIIDKDISPKLSNFLNIP